MLMWCRVFCFTSTNNYSCDIQRYKDLLYKQYFDLKFTPLLLLSSHMFPLSQKYLRLYCFEKIGGHTDRQMDEVQQLMRSLERVT